MNYDGIESDVSSLENSDFCKKDGCNNFAFFSDYCSEHTPSTSTYRPYCKYPSCYNRVTYSWNKYCYKHSYLEY